MVVVSLSSCFFSRRDPEQPPARVQEVGVYEIRTEMIRQEFRGFGNLSFRKKADIKTMVAGKVKSVFVDEGDSVSSGQPLAELYNIQLVIRKQQAKAALFSAESEYELSAAKYREGRLLVEGRLIAIEKSELELSRKERELEYWRKQLEKSRELFSIGGTTSEEIAETELTVSNIETETLIMRKDIMIKQIGFRDRDIKSYGYDVPTDNNLRKKLLLDLNTLNLRAEQKAAEAGVLSAETELESANALLAETSVSSPIKGIVGAKYLETGESTGSDTKIFTVFSTSELDLVFTVPEETGVQLSNGQKVDLQLDAVSDRSFSAEIRQISPTVDTRSGSMTVKAGLTNDEGLFKPGMFSRFSITYGAPRKTIRIPDEAVLRRDGDTALVIKITGGRCFPSNIEVTKTVNGMYEIAGGLKEGDLIILNPSPLLKEGEPVVVKK